MPLHRSLLPLSLTLTLLFQLGGPTPSRAAPASPTLLPYPILFVTQIPIAADFTTIGSTFGNHLATLDSAGRGGDLWIRYPDGTLKNLTLAAGYGGSGFLTGNAGIAVRDPAVHWSGTKAIFSMVVGAPDTQYDYNDYYWQMYEVTGFNYPTQTVTITKVPNQPTNYNNVSPLYASDGNIIFTTDRPRNGSALLYPQLDEYEEAPTVTGLWKLNPATGALTLLNHAPSGNFSPSIDSFGRVIFTQWDHLQRDQQADADSNYAGGVNDCGSGSFYGTFNYVSEDSSAYNLNDRAEVFPEPRACRTDLLNGTNLVGHNFNQFFPWMINQDGTDGEILNHLGRHEFGTYSELAFNDDPNVIEYYRQYGTIANQNPIYTGMFQIREAPAQPGAYYAVDAPEFGTHASGQIISTTAPPGLSPDQVQIIYVTSPTDDEHYREPVPLSDGSLIAVHTAFTSEETGTGTNSDYDFRLKQLAFSNGYWADGAPLTPGITKSVSYWQPDYLVSYSGVWWELNPVEVRPRPAPTTPPYTLGAPEQQMFNAANVNVAEFQAYLQANNLALAVSRNVTTRDDLDKQQPFNLRIPGGAQTLGASGTIYDLKYMQFFQADQLRGLTFGGGTPREGRRVLAQAMHDSVAIFNNPPTTGPTGSVVLGLDGSMAAFVPAQRALTWQTTDPNGVGVVRERYWLTFQPGEIRVCTSCHGLSTLDQAGNTAPTNPPQALYDLLLYWKDVVNPPVMDLFVSNAVTITGALTATLTWTPPSNAITITLRYSNSLITEANWASALLLTDTLTGTASMHQAVVPYTGGTAYFALKYQNDEGEFAELSNNAFWPYWRVLLPALRR